MTNQNFRVKNGLEVGNNIKIDSGSGIFVRTDAGIHTLSNVGVGTTSIIGSLTIGGNKKGIHLAQPQTDIRVSISTFSGEVVGIVSAFSVFNLINTQANQNYTVNNRSGSLSGIGFTVTLYRNASGEINSYYIGNGGSGFVLYERIVIPGNLIGGSTPLDDFTITVTEVSGGTVTNIHYLIPGIFSEANKSYYLYNLSGNSGGSGFGFFFTRNNTGGLNSWGPLSSGENFSLYEKIIIPGNLIGGTTPTDDFKVTVTQLQSAYRTRGTNIFVGDTNVGGTNNSSGTYNIFLGHSVGHKNISGCINNFFGRCSGYYNISGSRNNFFGESVGYYNTTGSWNNFVGSTSGYCNTSGASNNFFGYAAGYYNTTGSYNSSFGNGAGNYNQSGCFNTFLGNYTGLSTSASYKVVIGSGEYWGNNFDSPDTDKNYQFAVGIRTDANPSNYWLVGDENFNIGIGTTNPLTKLHVGGDVRVGIDTSQGVILSSPNGTQYRLVVDDSGNLTTTLV